MSNISRHQAGTQIAGQKTGGQFKAAQKTAAGGFSMYWRDGTSQEVLDALDSAGIDSVTVEGEGVDTALILGSAEFPLEDLYADGVSLTAAERAAAVVARAEYMMDADRLARISNVRLSIAPELEALRQAEIQELQERVDTFTDKSRWAEGNLLIGRDRFTLTDERVWAGGRYSEEVELVAIHDNDTQEYRLTQTLTIPQPPFSTETLNNYRHEIDSFYEKHYGGTVTRFGGDGEITISRISPDAVGAATEDAVDDLRGENMHSTGCFNEFPDEELFQYISTHSKVSAFAILQARDDWEGVEDVVARLDDFGDRARAGDWAVVAQATAPTDKRGMPVTIREFLHKGLVSPSLSADLVQYAQKLPEGDEFQRVASRLAARLHDDRPFIDRKPPVADWS